MITRYQLRNEISFRSLRSWIAFVALVMAWDAAVGAPTQVCASNICVERAWARATPGEAQTAAVYFSLLNNGNSADRLTAASTAAAGLVMLHRTTASPGNVVRMEMVNGVDLAPGARVTFAPTGYHVMLEGLKQRLTQGTTITLTLEFAKASSVVVSVQILGAAATGPASSAD